jgi:hypothetical protein
MNIALRCATSAAAGNGLGTAAHQQSCSYPAAVASRSRGDDIGTTIKYLLKVNRRESCLVSVQIKRLQGGLYFASVQIKRLQGGFYFSEGTPAE